MIVEGAYTFDSGVACAEALLARRPRPTAIFACNDEMAAGVYKAAYRLRISIPEELSVVGFDDIQIALHNNPSLTTVRQPVMSMARLAAELIIEHSPRRLGWPSPLPHRTLDFELIVRDSTAAPALSP